LEILYNIIIYPLVQIIEFVFIFAQRTFKETGISVIAVSGAISLLCLPLYNVAEKWQQIERDTQKKLKPKIDKIKAVFRGDEQYMILCAYYRQNNYHPVYAMRNTFSLLIQIPFFIAAYSYLSHIEALQGARFLFISDLGAPDALIKIGAEKSVNLLPILMTLINAVSGAVYTKGFPFRDKAQLYGMALIFLLLLYNSPAGLVLYWTLNNVFSLIKNCVKKTKYSKAVLYYFFIIAAAALDMYVLFIHGGYPLKRFLTASVITAFLILVLAIKAAKSFFHKFISSINFSNTAVYHTRTFINSVIILFLLSGAAIPGSIIASSPVEFSFIETDESPLLFFGAAMFQSMGFFLFWCPVIYFFFSKKIKSALALTLSVLSVIALTDTFVFPGDYGFITTTLVFSNLKNLLNPETTLVICNFAVILAAAALCVILLLSKKKIILYSIQTIIIISLTTLSVWSIIKIQTEFSYIAAVYKETSDIFVDNTLKPVYHFSQNGKNVIVIMLDRGISGYVPYIFEEKPELLESFKGFTWYPNCVSLGGYTLIGLPPLFGGYEYSPLKMQEEDDRLLVEKYNEALLVLPKLFLDNGFSVTVTDPTQANFSSPPDLRIYDEYKTIHVENLHGRYLAYWQRKYPDMKAVSVSSLLKNNLIHFSLFKMSPILFRIIIYDKGNWLVSSDFSAGGGKLTQLTLDNYTMLDMLSKITVVDDSNMNTYTAMTNDLTHEPGFLQAPLYVPSTIITNKGNSPFAGEPEYHVNMAALVLLGKWFDYLKQHNVYDNSRIIIVSDHGWYHSTRLPNNFTLPNGDSLIMFNPILLVKDFSGGAADDNTINTDDTINTTGAASGGAEIKTDYTFMTHADVPYLASEGITNALNPFTQASLLYDKTGGITITSVHRWETADPRKYKWRIRLNEWLHVRDNIFDPKNWGRAEK
jgi:YidC/Oxa1 family membrane protein insertase